MSVRSSSSHVFMSFSFLCVMSIHACRLGAADLTRQVSSGLLRAPGARLDLLRLFLRRALEVLGVVAGDPLCLVRGRRGRLLGDVLPPFHGLFSQLLGLV